MTSMTVQIHRPASSNRCVHGVEQGKCRSCDGTDGYVYSRDCEPAVHATPECPALRGTQDPFSDPEPMTAIRESVASSEVGRRPCQTCCVERARWPRAAFSLSGELDPIRADSFLEWTHISARAQPRRLRRQR